jgi:hypothetical protein
VIAHLVLFRPRSDLATSARAALADALVAALQDIPSIRRVRMGRRVMTGRPYESLMRVNYSHAAVLEFDDLDGLRAYFEHPVHEQLAARFFDAFEEALFYDYELEEGAAGIAAMAAP